MSETPAIPLGPSRLVRVVMTPLTKMLNPLVAALAGRRHFPMAAQIHHVGRRTGTPYVTSVGARVHDGIVLVPLTTCTRRVSAPCGSTAPITTPWHRNSSRPPKPHLRSASCSVPSNDSSSRSLEYGNSCGCSWPPVN